MNTVLKRNTDKRKYCPVENDIDTNKVTKSNKSGLRNNDVMDSKIYLPLVIQKKIFSYVKVCEVCNIVIDPADLKSFKCFIDLCPKCMDIYSVITLIVINDEKRNCALELLFLSDD